MSMMNKSFEEQIEFIKERIYVSDDNVAGCFLSNFRDVNVCSGIKSCGCKNFKLCERMEEVLNEQSK